MKTLIQLNINKEPIAVFTTYTDIEIPQQSQDYIEVDTLNQVSPETILKRWRFTGGKLQDVGMPPAEYFIWSISEGQWIDPRTPETEWPLVRAERDRRLLASDWTQLPDVPLATKEAWAEYRQALRDITLQPDPFNIVWPQPPQ